MKTSNILVLSFLIFLSINTYSQTNNNEPHLKANVGHTDVITDFVLSKNNKYLATCSEDKSIILWDFETAKEIKTIRGHKNNISCIDISSDNTMIASGESGKDDIASFDVKIWDVKIGNEIRTIKPNAGKIKLVKFTNDGKFLFVGGTLKIIYYDLETGSNIKDYTGFKNELLNISISNDKKFISANNKNKIFLWDINKRETIKVIDKGLNNLTSIVLDSKGNSVITGSDDNIIRIFNTISGEETNKIASHRYPIFKLAVNNDNKFIASSDDKSQFFKIFDYNTGQELNSIDAHKGRVGIIKINTNNQFVITAGSWDRKVKVWDLNSGDLIKTFSGIDKYIYESTYIDSSGYYAIGKYKNQAFINFMARHIKNKNFKDKNGEITCVTLSNNKKLIAYGTSKNHITVLNANTDTVLHSFTSQNSWIREIAFSTDDKYLATGSFEQIKIWDIESGKEIISIDKKFKVSYKIAFSKDSKLVAVGCRNAAKIFNIETGKLINKLGTKNIVYSLDFSNNGKYLLTGEGNESEKGEYEINIWDLDKGKSIKTLEAYKRQITSVKFSNNDKLIASSGDKLIKIWDFETAKEIKQINAHARWINDIGFSKDDKRIISASQDGTIKIWDLTSGDLLLTEIGLKASENWISYTPDGRFNGTDEGIKSFYFVKDMQIVPLENLYEKFYTPRLTAEISVNKLDTNINISKLKNLPEIAITKPSNKAPAFRGSVETLLSTNEKNTVISTEVTDMGGGVEEIRIYQNNKLIISDTINLNETGEKVAKDYDINLAKGLNIIEIASYNNDRTKSSKRIGIEYTGDEFHPANLYVFAIGINDYKKPSYNLNYAVSDATSFAKELTKNSETIFKTTEIITLTNEQATKDSILACFNSIKEKAEQSDVFVFYYAGHGSMSAAEPESKSEFYLIPWEITNLYNNQMLKTKGISASKLQEFSKEIKAQKQLFVLDACQSGGAVEYLASRGSEEEKAIAQLAHSTGTYFITASGSQQLAGEFGALGHGVFTYAVLEALQGKASTKDGKVTVKELTYYVEEQVPVLSERYKGNAQYPTSYGFGQNFPLVLISDK